MSKDFSIDINKFHGIDRTIAEKANVNGGNTLEGNEISIFYQAKQTLNTENNTFFINGKQYDIEGNESFKYVPYAIKEDFSELIHSFKNSVSETYTDKIENDKALKQVSKYMENRRKTITKIADSWAKKYNVSGTKEEFTKFVEELYNVAAELNITKTTFPYNPAKYPTKEDQIVDELCGMFANESKFSTKAQNGSYYGIFQANDLLFKDLKQKGLLGGLKMMNRASFLKLSRLEQLKYFVPFIKGCKKYYSHINNETPISAAQIYAMNWMPAEGESATYIKKTTSFINAKLKERGDF